MILSDLRIIILPGLDGAAVLRRDLADLLSSKVSCRIIEFPPDRLTRFDEIADFVIPQLEADRNVVLLSESFSGPIALRVGSRMADRLRGLILVGSYVFNPYPWPVAALRGLVGSYLFRLPPPEFLIRFFIVGSRAADHKMPLFKQVAQWVDPRVLAGRVRAAFHVDARQELSECRVPILHIMAQHDRILPIRAEKLIGKIHPQVKTVMLNTGHCMIECRPELVAPVVLDFLNEISQEVKPAEVDPADVHY